jgi:diguanylate cyclase (GGDEF)-like protein/PAS domain S-box-containing protein
MILARFRTSAYAFRRVTVDVAIPGIVGYNDLYSTAVLAQPIGGLAMTGKKPSSKSNPKPRPHDSLIDVLPDGIILLDPDNRITDINPAAENLLGPAAKKAPGKSIGEIIPPLYNQSAADQPVATSSTFPAPSNPDRTIEAVRLPLPSVRGKAAGSLLLLRDVTDRTRMEHDHKRSMELMLEQTTEIQSLTKSLQQQAIRDPVTGLYNRFYLLETFQRELARAARVKTPISVLMIHLDRFEQADATYGERAGVEILKILSSLILRYIRKGDIASRYNEEDFVVILSGAPPSVAGPRAEQLRRAFHDSILNFLGAKIDCTFSCGVVSYPNQGNSVEGLLQSVEKAMRESVAGGGNRVTAFD